MKIEIELDEEQAKLFEEMVTQISEADTFSTDCIGTWACGIAYRKESPNADFEWLVYEEEEPKAENEAALIEQFRDFSLKGDDLPEGYYLLDLRKCKAIVKAGLLQHGLDFLDGTCDVVDLDKVIQKILLGEVRYW